MSYNTDDVRRAWQDIDMARRQQAQINAGPYATSSPTVPYSWVKEVWNDFLIVCTDGPGAPADFKVPYTVADDGTVTFDTPVPVKQEYVELSGEPLWKESATDRLRNLLELGRAKKEYYRVQDGKKVLVHPHAVTHDELHAAAFAMPHAEHLSKDLSHADRSAYQDMNAAVQRAFRVSKNYGPDHKDVHSALDQARKIHAEHDFKLPDKAREKVEKILGKKPAEGKHKSVHDALDEVESHFDALRHEEGDNGPMGVRPEHQDVLSNADRIRKGLKNGEYEGKGAKLRKHLHELAQDVKDHGSTQDEEIKDAVVEKLKAAGNSALKRDPSEWNKSFKGAGPGKSLPKKGTVTPDDISSKNTSYVRTGKTDALKKKLGKK